MDNVVCNSSATTIQDCSYGDDTTEDCGSDEGAGVYCHVDNMTSTGNGTSIDVESNKVIGEVDGRWGPLYRVSLDLIVWSFSSDWSNILAFKGNQANNDCCNNGDRIPLINSGANNYLRIANSINGNGNYYRDIKITSNQWYNIVIEQVLESNNQVMSFYQNTESK